MVVLMMFSSFCCYRCRCSIRVIRVLGPNNCATAAAVRVFWGDNCMWSDKMNHAWVVCMDLNSRMVAVLLVAMVVRMVDVVHRIHYHWAERNQRVAYAADHRISQFPNKWDDRLAWQRQIDRSFVDDRGLAVMDMHHSDQNRMYVRTVVKWVVVHMLMDNRNSDDICLWQFDHMVAIEIGLHVWCA